MIEKEKQFFNDTGIKTLEKKIEEILDKRPYIPPNYCWSIANEIMELIKLRDQRLKERVRKLVTVIADEALDEYLRDVEIIFDE